MIFPKIDTFIKSVLLEADTISAARREQLLRLVAYIRSKRAEEETAQLIFICTHNSRRSHLGQVWTAVAAYYFNISGIRTYSGGTEATAFNPRAIAALARIGFRIPLLHGDNPKYQLYFSESEPPIIVWSKKYDDPANPEKDFAAIMTCSDADENCPFIPGASFRLSLTYEDPKVADGTPQEAVRYDERVRQIGREICWMMRALSLP